MVLSAWRTASAWSLACSWRRLLLPSRCPVADEDTPLEADSHRKDINDT